MSAPITNIPFSNPLYRNHNFYRRYGKRALDFTGALFGLICLFPVLAILAILLAIVQRTSPFFLQKRIGHGPQTLSYHQIQNHERHQGQRREPAPG